MPARSNASHAASSSSRCCGSIASASRGQIPKNPASKSVASAHEARPARAVPAAEFRRGPAAVGRERRRSRRVRRPRSSHRSAGEVTPPGYRQLIADDRDGLAFA